MRKLTTKETFFFFKDRFKTVDIMVTAFNILKSKDKENEFVNKTYIVQCEYNYYRYDDIMKVLKYDEEVHNTICYAQQLIVDLGAIFENRNIKAIDSKLAKLTGVHSHQIGLLSFSYKSALKCIRNIEDKIKSLSYEALMDLKQEYKQISE